MKKAIWMAAIAAVGTLPLAAQWGRGGNTTSFRPRFSSMSTNGADGRCVIRVMIDDQADVILNGDTVTIRALTGRPGRDDGSECTSPMPRGANVQFRGIDGRGDVRMVSNNPPVVHINDPKGGEEGYTFELRWAGGYGNGGYNNGPYNNGPYANGPYNNGPYNNGPYNNGPYNNGPYNNGPYNNRNGYPNNGGYNVGAAAGACADMARSEIRRRYGARDRDLSVLGSQADNNRGRRDAVYGEMQNRRNGERYTYECRADLNSGQVRDVRVNRR